MLLIRQLTLHHFRNYLFANIETGGGSVILTGANGAGKTNILEAISLLSPGRGLRKATLRELNHISPSQLNPEPEGEQAHERVPAGATWVVSAKVEGLQGAVHIGTSLDCESQAERRLIKIDGEKTKSQTALADHLAISWHTPLMDGLFLASDGERRRFLDRLIYNFDAAHLTRVNRYEHAMRERNKLLEAGSSRADAAWLNALEETMAQAGVAIAAARLDLLQRLNAFLQEEKEGAFPSAALAMHGEVESLLQQASVPQAVAQMQVSLEQSRRRDAAAGRALYGAHRSQWQVVYSTKNCPAARCSTGEQKALLISILLAHACARRALLGQAPILVLDETVAHLDAQRRRALSQLVQRLDTQLWMTGTDAADFAEFEAFSAHFVVENGEVSKR